MTMTLIMRGYFDDEHVCVYSPLYGKHYALMNSISNPVNRGVNLMLLVNPPKLVLLLNFANEHQKFSALGRS